jgi:hypothetical protein
MLAAGVVHGVEARDRAADAVHAEFEECADRLRRTAHASSTRSSSEKVIRASIQKATITHAIAKLFVRAQPPYRTK